VYVSIDREKSHRSGKIQTRIVVRNQGNPRWEETPSLDYSTVARIKEKHTSLFLKLQHAYVSTQYKRGHSSGQVIIQNIEVVYKHTRLTVNGFLKMSLKKGDTKWLKLK
jgi:hypothetical protein